MKFRIIISLLLLGLLIYLLPKALGAHDLRETLLSFPPERLLLLGVLSLFITFLKGVRFYILLKNIGIQISFLRTLRLYTAGLALSPIPGGETIRGVLLFNDLNIPAVKSAAPILTQAYLELATAAFFVFIGSFIFHEFTIPALIVTAIIIIITLLLVKRSVTRLLLDKLNNFPKIQKFLKTHLNIQQLIRKNLFINDGYLPDKDLSSVIALSVMSTMLGGLLVLIAANSFQVNLDFIRSTFIYSSSIVISSLAAISPGGLGLTEGGLTGILLVSNVPIAQAISIVLVVRAATFLFNLILGILTLIIFYGKTLFLSKNFFLKEVKI